MIYLDEWDAKLVILAKSDVDQDAKRNIATSIWAERCGIEPYQVRIEYILQRMALIVDHCNLTTIERMMNEQNPNRYGGLIFEQESNKSWFETWYDSLSCTLMLSEVSSYPDNFLDNVTHYGYGDVV